MDHKLKVLVRLDIENRSASLEITGCLTEASCGALLPLIRRTRNFAGGLAVTVDLSSARHIDDAALERLEQTTRALLADPHVARSGAECAVSVRAPKAVPTCPVLRRQRELEAARDLKERASNIEAPFAVSA